MCVLGGKVVSVMLTLFDPGTCQAPLSMGFSRQEYRSGLPCPPPGNVPYPEIKSMFPVAPAMQADSLLLSHQGNL